MAGRDKAATRDASLAYLAHTPKFVSTEVMAAAWWGGRPYL